MAALSRTEATLRVFSEALDPAEISALLLKEPHSSYRRGEVIRTPSGGERVAKLGSWSFSASVRTPGNLDAQVAEILDGMSDSLEVWHIITSAHKTDLFCGLFLDKDNEGLPIQPCTLKILGDRGIILDLDIYAPVDDEHE